MRALTVFTAKSVEQILAEGGTSSWSLSPSSMKDVAYAICTRNRDRDLEEGFEPGPEAHRTAFMVGKVSGLRKARFDNGRQRYLVCFTEYALVDIPEFWPKHRSPVTYLELSREMLNVDALDWQPMPEPTHDVRMASKCSRPALSQPVDSKHVLKEAKEQVARALGVPVASVTISVSI